MEKKRQHYPGAFPGDERDKNSTTSIPVQLTPKTLSERRGFRGNIAAVKTRGDNVRRAAGRHDKFYVLTNIFMSIYVARAAAKSA